MQKEVARHEVHDCMDAGGRATPGAVAEEAQMSQVHGCTGATRRKL